MPIIGYALLNCANQFQGELRLEKNLQKHFLLGIVLVPNRAPIIFVDCVDLRPRMPAI